MQIAYGLHWVSEEHAEQDAAARRFERAFYLDTLDDNGETNGADSHVLGRVCFRSHSRLDNHGLVIETQVVNVNVTKEAM